MNTKSQFISYQDTGFFSKISLDYISGAAALQAFYKHDFSMEGIKSSIEARKQFPTNRKVLVDVLEKQYAHLSLSEKQQFNLEQLKNDNCFTITTAHQPNIFTGHLYFIYKILHAVKIAEQLNKEIPENNFVPVYYMGSEDADLDELGHIFVDGQKYEWQTKQTGAVGRMKVDNALVALIGKIAGQVLVHPFGEEIISAINTYYKEGVTIEKATFEFVNFLFKDYGVLVLLPDDADLKRLFIPVFEKELIEKFSHEAVQKTVAAFPHEYKVQTSGREINLFYLTDNARERITIDDSQFTIHNSPLKFTESEILADLHSHPERFSPNVILRPAFQEMILPNIVFVGGGGELAYWLELKNVFEAADIPYPVLILRNSFLFIENKINALINKLGLTIEDLFLPEQELINGLVKKQSKFNLSLENEKQGLNEIYKTIQVNSGAIDIMLQKHVDALKTIALKKIEALEKKMLRAEKKKFEAEQRQLHKIKEQLFPKNSLQERVENIIPFFSRYGKGFLDTIYKNSLSLEQEFELLIQE